MEDWSEIRRRVLVEGVSRRQILRETGLHWLTLKKILEHSEPPGYRQRQPRRRKKLGGGVSGPDRADPPRGPSPAAQTTAPSQAPLETAAGEEGFTGGYTVVKDAVRELTQKHPEVFVPLVHPPGEAQVDFGQTLARVNGQLRKVAFFVMALPYSDAVFVMAFERECTETFWEGHVQAFEFFGGVPRRITYDNTKVAVSQILGGGRERRLTQGFLQLKSHHLFAHHFCRVARGNEKGVVEGLVKFTRLNFFVPVPQVRDLEELNAHLRRRCLEDRQRRLRGQAGTKAQLLTEDQKAFLPLPVTRFEACRRASTTASSLSLVRFEPLHYLALLETKPGALDYARPLQGWTLPECFAVLRRRLEAQRDGDGTREYIRVLRLLEKHSLSRLRRAVEQALAVGAITRDAIAQFLYPREDGRITLFSLDGHPNTASAINGKNL